MRPTFQGACSDRMFFSRSDKATAGLLCWSAFFVVLSGNNVDLSLASQVASCLKSMPADHLPSGGLGHPGGPSLH